MYCLWPPHYYKLGVHVATPLLQIGSTCVLFAATPLLQIGSTCVLFVATPLLQIGSTCVLFVAAHYNVLHQ